ncbi:MAG: DNA recombination protein RmuC, partial [Pseudomonadota bacterium]|nr:DNA recombination protein RmuC [Pseudomonadota bacterium]
MTTEWVWVIVAAAAIIGAIFGALIGSLRARQRAQALHVEIAVLKAQVKGEEQLERERQSALERSMERLKTQFDTLASSSLRSNSESFLQLAREHLTQHQQRAVTALGEREKAIETMLTPIREALGKTEQQILRIEKERAETFGSLKASLESVALGQAALQKE